MRSNDLIFDTEVIESENVLRRPTFESVKIFDLKMIFVPFEFQARSVCHQSLQVGLVE